ncbi:hypothetical protein HK099_005663, partial [Clydaea vesicula]
MIHEQSVITAEDFLTNQLDLEKQAKKLFKSDSNKCAITEKKKNQKIYVCLTCSKENTPSGLELFNKRDFKCDCGNYKMKNSCELFKKDLLSSEDFETNVYNHNFCGKYCYCDTAYDVENDVMFQCLFCQDW